MKHLLSLFLLSLFLQTLPAQEKHFVFIQSDNNLPFYVSLNKKLYSSSTSGYLIIPKLTDGEYQFSVGFAKNQYPEQSFQCTIDKKDLGFNLKNFGDKGWGLFNLQSLGVIMAGATTLDDMAKAISSTTEVKTNDEPLISFDKKQKDTTAVVSAAMLKDSSANVAETKVQADSNPAPADTVAANAVKQNATADSALTAPATNTQTAISNTDPAVTKVSETKSAEGVHLAYIDGKNTDTINVIIPSAPVPDASEDNSKLASDIAKTNTAVTKPVTTVKDKADSDLKFLDLDMKGAKKDSTQSAAATTQSTAVTSTTNCTNIATDEDFAKLKKKMAMATSDEKMIAEAKKGYKNKCFTTSQVKGLSTLFLSDEGRLNFFNASYPSVADTAQYATLQSEFIDPAFVTRFKAMLQ